MVDSGGSPTTPLNRPLCNSRIPFFSHDTDPVVYCVVAPAVRDMRQVHGGRHQPEGCGTPHATHWGAVTLLVSDALATFTLLVSLDATQSPPSPTDPRAGY